MATLSATDRGHQEMMDVYFRGSTVPTDFYVALFNDTAVQTDDHSDLVNPQTGTGYAIEVIARDATGSGWPTLALDSGEMQIVSLQVTFTATAGDWIATTCIAVVANMVTDRLLMYANISSVTVGNGESLSVTVKYKLTAV